MKFRVPKINFVAAVYVNLLHGNRILEKGMKERIKTTITKVLKIRKN